MTDTPASLHNLVDCLLHWEKTKPDAVYLTQPYADSRVEDYTWREVAEQARRGAAYLRSLNFPKGSNIGILGKNSAHWIIADLAIWMAGHVSVPLYATLNAETAQYILQDSEAKLLILGKMDGTTDTWNDVKDHLPPDLPILSLPMSPRQDVTQWLDLMKQHAPMKDQDIVQRDDNALATIVYTSGSTGQPKGVMHSFHSMTGGMQGLKDEMGVTENDRMLSYLPLAHVAERAAVETNSLYSGFRVYFAETLETFQADMKRARPTIFFSVPRLWTKFYLAINHKISPAKQRILFAIPLISKIVKKKILTELGMDQIRFALTGAAPLPPDIIMWYRKLGLELLEVYGMSEDFGNSHIGRIGEVRIGYVGRPTPSTLSRIAENGELEVKSPSLMLGYYKLPDKTAAEMTPDGYFKTGDRGEFDEQGRLRITGRVKELFKTSKGKYIAPAPIENKFNHPRLEVTCVTGPNLPQPFILLMLSLDTRQALDSGALSRDVLTAEFEQLLSQVNATLEDHEKLAFAVVVKDQWTMENGFLTPTMKIKRNVIEARYLPFAEGWQGRGEKVIWEE
ncbi:MAG: AMP-binding protein [Gammaproteobacteria bacterium]|nr:AMP-binding protein [Gammaproteobacteria bacterium]